MVATVLTGSSHSVAPVPHLWYIKIYTIRAATGAAGFRVLTVVIVLSLSLLYAHSNPLSTLSTAR